MQMKYNIYIELAAIAYVFILCVYHEVQDSNHLEVNRAYKKMAWTVLAAVCMDVITAITISYAEWIPVWINMILNTLYFELDALIAYYFACYVSAYVYEESKRQKILRVNHILHAVYFCMLLINIPFGWVFSFDAVEGYLHGPIYLIVFIMPFYYLVFTVGMLIRNWGKFQKKQQVSIIFFVISVSVGPLVQTIFFPDVLISVFTGTIGLIILHYSLETPDYQLLMQTMEELKQAKEDALKANSAKGKFLANMSHELRTPINAILGFDEMIMKETQESHTLEYAVNVQSAGRILTSIVNDILDFISIDEGDLKLEVKPYDTMSMVQDITSFTKYFAGQKDLECRLSVDDTLPQKLSGDVIRLIQVMNNLISNGVKFTQEGYIELAISWQEQEEEYGMLCVSVSDSGIGMRSEDVERLIHLGEAEKGFQRFDDRNTRNIQGIGLGLTIVTRLLSLMGSHLEVTSEYGKGSVFSFSVRQKIVTAAPIGKIEDNIEILQAENQKAGFVAPDAKILVADDNAMNLDMFKGLLKQTKIQIDTAMNGQDALDLLKENQYHLIFLDHMMPVLDGMETLEEMKKRNLSLGVPVIALTANAVVGAREEYLAAGFKDYLSKPIKGRHLENMVKKYLPSNLLAEEEKQSQEEPREQQEPQGQKIDKGRSFLSKLPFLDTDTGMIYCCENEEFYREMILSYLDNRRDEELEDFFEQEYWGNYRIAVHALKSTSLSIGAVEVSEQAKALETAAKEGDISYLVEHHDKLMEDYRKLLGQLDRALNGQEEARHPDKEVVEGLPRIFAVDDDSMNLKIIERILEEEYAVNCFTSGEKLLEALKDEIPGMILLDVQMPGMDGFEVLKRLKENKDYQGIPVIFLTADENRDTEIKGFEEGVLDFIRKPFVAEIMMQRIKRILQLDSLQKDLQSEVEKQAGKAVEESMRAERLTVEIVQTLAGAIDAKDKYTNGHSIRVAQYARAIAARLGKSEKEIDDVYVTGLLHDVGKIGIPDEIINKPDKLTDEEYAIIKTHPAIGANILSGISEIPDIAVGAHWHHERYDGKGYPDGLEGTDIPEMARIIGVADAYDAMASKRSYRDVLPQEVVRRELEKGRGTQFDPEVADAMLSLMDEDVEYQMREH